MKKEFMALVGGAILASITGCATKSGAAVDTAAYISDAKIIVSPYDWGPAVDKIVLSMSSEISAACRARILCRQTRAAAKITKAFLRGSTRRKRNSAWQTKKTARIFEMSVFG